MADEVKWPGMVTLVETETGKERQFYPIDAREIMRLEPGLYSLKEDGAVEAGRMNGDELRSLSTAKKPAVAAKAEAVKVEATKTDVKADTVKAA